MELAGFPLPDPTVLSDAIEAQLVERGCDDVAGSYRATVDSLMNTSIPVLGSVNLRWALSILDLWEGQAW